MIARPHAPVFTDDSGVRRVTVQWGGRVIALACVALWAALALTLGTQVSLPGLDRLPSLSDDIRRALLSDTRLTAVPDVDRRQSELNRVSGVDVPRALPRPVDDSAEARTAVGPQRSIKDPDRTEAVVKEVRDSGKFGEAIRYGETGRGARQPEVPQAGARLCTAEGQAQSPREPECEGRRGPGQGGAARPHPARTARLGTPRR